MNMVLKLLGVMMSIARCDIMKTSTVKYAPWMVMRKSFIVDRTTVIQAKFVNLTMCLLGMLKIKLLVFQRGVELILLMILLLGLRKILLTCRLGRLRMNLLASPFGVVVILQMILRYGLSQMMLRKKI